MRRKTCTAVGGAVALLLAASVACADDLASALKQLRSRDPDQQRQGALKASQLGEKGKRAVPVMIRLLRSPEWQVRNTLGRALKRLGRHAVPGLLKAMKSKDPEMRFAVACVLKEIGRLASESAAAVARLLDDTDERVRRCLAEAMVPMGAAALEPLVLALRGRSEDARSEAAWALAKLGAIALGPLQHCLDSESAGQRSGAAAALGMLGKVATLAQAGLRSLLKDPYPEVRASAARALGRVEADAESAVPALVDVLTDSEPDVRDAAVDGLARFGANAATALVTALGTDAVHGARRALLRMGEPATEALVLGLKSAAPSLRVESVRTLGQMDPLVRVYVDDLSKQLLDSDADVRCAAAEALRRRGPNKAVEFLIDAAKDPVASVRRASVAALGASNASAEVVGAVRAATKDADGRVRLAAHAALWQLGQPSEVLALARAFLRSDDAALRDAAALALRPMGRNAQAAIGDLAAAAEAGGSPALADALGGIAMTHGEGLLGRADRYRRAPAKVREAMEAALGWLARYQDTAESGVNDADGRWHSRDFVKHRVGATGAGGAWYSPGVTGLAVSAYLAVGRTEDTAFREGLGFLAKSQRPDGLFIQPKSQHFQIDHAFATAAVCEAWAVTQDPRHRIVAQRAVDMIVAMRNPELGWRYEPRGGENDTNVTVSMLHALALADRGGLDVPAGAFEGGGRWVRNMTDPLGGIGYNMPGGSCARPEGLQEAFPPEETQAMTAAGLWSFALTKRYGVAAPDLSECLKLCIETGPLWKGGRRDMYYWYWGALLFRATPGKPAKAWLLQLEDALIRNQRFDPPALSGSWDPCGPWGSDGGRVYSTALNALSLAVEVRFTPGYPDAEPRGAFAEAAQALAKLAKSGDVATAARANLWLRRLGR